MSRVAACLIQTIESWFVASMQAHATKDAFTGIDVPVAGQVQHELQLYLSTETATSAAMIASSSMTAFFQCMATSHSASALLLLRRSSATFNSGPAFSISNNASYEHAPSDPTARSDDNSDSRRSSSSGTAMRSYMPTPPRHGSFTAEQAAVEEQLLAVREQLPAGYPSTLLAHMALHGNGGTSSPRHTQQLSGDGNALQPVGGSGEFARQQPGHSRSGSGDSSEGLVGSFPTVTTTPTACNHISTTGLHPANPPPSSPRPQLQAISRPASAVAPGSTPQTPRSRMASSSTTAAGAAAAAGAFASSGGKQHALRVSIAADDAADTAVQSPARNPLASNAGSRSQQRRASLPETTSQQRPADAANSSGTPKAHSGSFAQTARPEHTAGPAESATAATAGASASSRVQGIGSRLLVPREGASSPVGSPRGSVVMQGKVAPWQQQGMSTGGLAADANGALNAFLASQQQSAK